MLSIAVWWGASAKAAPCQQDFPPQTLNTTAAIKLTNIKPCKLLLKVYSSSEVGAVHNTCSQSIRRRTWAADQLTPTLTAPGAQGGRLPGRGTGRSMDGRYCSLLPSALRHESRQLGGTRHGVTPRRDAGYFQWILPYSSPLKKLSEETSHREFICRDVFQLLYETLLLTALLVAEIVFSFWKKHLYFLLQ